MFPSAYPLLSKMSYSPKRRASIFCSPTLCVISMDFYSGTTSLMSKIVYTTLFSLILNGCANTPTALDYGDSTEVDEPTFQWPVYGAVVTQKFRPKKRSPYRRRHQGIDLAAPKDTPIHAIDHGIVSYAGHGFSGYGRLVIIKHINKKYRSFYAHLSHYKVERGDVVKKGDLVGLMGRSGRATGVHLHFEIRKDMLALNPLDLLPAPSVAAQQANP